MTARTSATFFQVGQRVDAYGAYSRRAYLEGHGVANHTWDRTQLTLRTRSRQQRQVDVTDNELNQHGVPDTTLLRPPYGSFNSLARELGVPLAIWDVDPRDWDSSPSAATVRRRVMSAVRPGDVVYRHGDVRSAGTASSPGDTITLPDGTVLGPFLDEAGVPGVAPSVPLLELLEQQR